MLARVRHLGGIAMLMVLPALFSAPAGLAQVVTSWQTETVDSEGIVGWETSLALDADGRPHISYYDNTMYYLKYAQPILNHSPMVDAGGPYTRVEGSPVTLGGGRWDHTNDDLPAQPATGR